jgi:hypothetical protein
MNSLKITNYLSLTILFTSVHLASFPETNERPVYSQQKEYSQMKPKFFVDLSNVFSD